MSSTSATQRHGNWLEAMALLEMLREGNQPAAFDLLTTSSNHSEVIGDVFSLISMLMRLEDLGDASVLDEFLATSYRVGPPPRFGARPFLPPSQH